MQIKKGFTIVELSLSIGFIAVLSIIVVVMISNAVSAYHKGLVLNQINTVGMSLVDDMRTVVQDSPARSVASECSGIYTDSTDCEADAAMSFIFMERYAGVKIGNNAATNVPVYGVFCTGAYSYIWNSGYWFNDSDYKMQNNTLSAAQLVYRVTGSTSNQTKSNFKLLKVPDDERLVCKAAAGVNEEGASATGGRTGGEYRKSSDHEVMPSKIDITSGVIDAEPEDLLAENSNLAIYDLVTVEPAENVISGNMFYAVSFILGTVQGGINVSATGDYCTAPGDLQNSGIENFDYCAINKFNFAATANGG